MQHSPYLTPLPSGGHVYSELADLLNLGTLKKELDAAELGELFDRARLSHFMGPQADALLQEFDSAYQDYLAEAARTRKQIEAQEETRAWTLLSEKLGLKVGDLVCWESQDARPTKQAFTLTGAHLNIYRGRPSITSLGLTGMDASGKKSASHIERSVAVTCFERAAIALGHPGFRHKAPADMTLKEIELELKDATEFLDQDRWHSDMYSKAHGDLLALLHTLQTEDFSPDPVLQMSEYANGPIYLDMEITSKDNLVIAWYASNGEVCPEHKLSSLFGHYRPNRLVQLNASSMYSRYARPTPTRKEGSAKDRFRDLLVYGIVAAVRAFLGKMRTVYQVANDVPWPVVEHLHGTPGCATLVLIPCGMRVLDPASKYFALEQPCQFKAQGLAMLTAYDWRNADANADAAWSTVLSDAGGAVLTAPFEAEFRQQLVSLYRHRDPVVQAERESASALLDQQQRAAQVEAEAQKIPNARAFLLSLDIGHKTGWSKQLAEHLGIHHTNAKRWIKQNLPDVFERLYPENKLLAQKLG